VSNFYAAIFGAGIAGTAIAHELQKRGKEVLLIDPHVSEDSPGAPAALVNPATGRHARMSWEAEACMAALRETVETIQKSHNGEPLISDTGVMRPAINEKLAESFRESLEKYDWPEGWIRWMDEDEVQELNPQIAPNHGALFLDCGFTVYVDRYLNAFRKHLRLNGAACRYEAARYEFVPEGNAYRILLESGESATANHVITAAGEQTPFFNHWQYLPLHRVKGQIVRYEADHDLNWDYAVSAMGYTLRRGKSDLIVGSTYEHKFEDLSVTEKAAEQIHGKLAKMLPEISGRVKVKDQLAGVRVTTPNKLPVIGRHREQPNLCIYTAMGSKGLLFSSYTARFLADHLVDRIPIPEELDTRRFDG
jgi:glycine/D-amino acid oxidase-like deaminating enzyme